MSNQVFVLDNKKQPLMPCHPARARELMKGGKAAVYRRFPFTIILKEREDGEVQPIQVKIDPGSVVTGIAVVQKNAVRSRVVFAAELSHRGHLIKDSLARRSMLRQKRRSRNTRYRKPRFNNRLLPQGWLPPSIESRLANIMTWIQRLKRICPIASFSQEVVRFDLKRMDDPDHANPNYKQGELPGYEIKEYLLHKWNFKCAYCGNGNAKLQVDHVHPKSKGGSDRASNLVVACSDCNKRKGAMLIAEFLRNDLSLLSQIISQTKSSLRDVAAVNSSRIKLKELLLSIGLPVEVGSGGQTKFNRIKQGYPKTHWIDAACIGESGSNVFADPSVKPLQIKSVGHGRHQIARTDKFGFPSRYCPRRKLIRGFKTGDVVVARIPAGKYRGCHVGKVTVRTQGSFQIGKVPVNPSLVKLVQLADGYCYSF